jgi:hypothetical protein
VAVHERGTLSILLVNFVVNSKNITDEEKIMVGGEFNLSDLDGFNGFIIPGIDSSDRSGTSVGRAGDVNGDGIDDIIIGAPGAEPNGKSDAGESYVVFGRTTGFTLSLDLSSLNGNNGFIINGIDGFDLNTPAVIRNRVIDRSGTSVSSAGDVNGDGIDDIIIGAPGADSNRNSNAGESYVVFGRTTGFTPTLDLSVLNGADGFIINGIGSDDESGTSVSSAGDVNGDGIDDIIIGAPFADPNGKSDAGESYVVFGSRAGFTPTLDLSVLNGADGFIIPGIDSDDNSGYSVRAAGDVNGDGIDDIIIGARRADPNGNSDAGESYVVFGRTTGFTPTLDLSTLNGEAGFIINGINNGFSGTSVSRAGDVNGDGIDDIIIGARRTDPNGNTSAGESYVVFGRTTGFIPTLDLSTLNGEAGFIIPGIDSFDSSGTSVSRAGDVNGDGFDDIIIGALFADPNGNENAGESYVVFGRTTGFTPTLDLSTLNGANGFIINGIDGNSGSGNFNSGDRSGTSVGAAGDVNGDGIDDIIVGAPYADPNSNISAGASYVVYGNTSPTVDLNGANPGINFLTNFNGIPVSIVDPDNLTITDNNNAFLTSATVSITKFFNPLTESLSANTENTSIAANYDSQTGTLSLTGRDTIANYQQVLRTVTYSDTDTSSTSTVRSINFVVENGEVFSNTSAPVTTTLLLSEANNNAPTAVSLSNNNINENVLPNSIIGTFNTTDPNIDDVFTYSLVSGTGDTDNNAFTITSNQLRFAISPDFETQSSYNIRVRTTDAFGSAVEETFIVNVNDLKEAPIALLLSNDSINENVPANSGVGIFSTIDPDINDDSFTYRLVSGTGDTDNGAFTIIGNQLRFSISPDFETQSSYSIRVRTTDASGLTFEQALSVNVNNVADTLPNAFFNLSELNDINGFIINGTSSGDNSGYSVNAAGDVNGDGIDDIIIGAPRAGESYVVFGSSALFTSSLNLSSLNGANGFTAGVGFRRLGISVSGAGDVNGDGIDDIIVGAPPERGPGLGRPPGESYVVFGSSAGFARSLDLSSLNGEAGFIINGINNDDFLGTSVGGAGDVNGDGIDDIIITATGLGPLQGESYVVFGTTAGFSPSLNLSDLNGTNGFIINSRGRSVGAAGDVNADSIDDIIIGAEGESYVVFGSSNGFAPSLEVSELNGANGFIINGGGGSVSAAGDINGDEIDDIIIGVPGADPNGKSDAGESYVVFGRTTGFTPSLDLSSLNGEAGFIIPGIDGGDYSGTSVGRAGDVNGDGIDDIIIGARNADPNGNSQAGESYVVFGSTAGFTPSFNLLDLDGEAGFIINGIDSGDSSGRSVGRAGDVNGDGIDDIIIGAPNADPTRNSAAGETYVIYGNASPTLDLNSATPGIDFTTTSPLPISPNLTVSDINTPTLNVATITITNPLDGSAETLSANTDNTSITANYNPINGTLTLAGTDTIANYQQVLQSITYNNTIPAPDTTARIVEFVVDDGQAFSNTSDVRTITLSINANTSIVDGTPGRDTLSGTNNNNRIAGFSGADILTGGGGNNIFVYNSIRDSGDTITDFEVGADVILLSRNIFQAPSNFNYNIATTGGFLGFRTQGNNTTILIDPDGTEGSALPTPLVRVSGVAVSDLASAGNFVL